MKKKILQKLDYFFVLRPMLFFPGWATLLAGYLINYRSEVYFTPSQIAQIDLRIISLLLVLFAMAMGASFLLNQLKDIQSDMQNDKLFIVSGGYLQSKAVRWEIIFLILVALGLSLYLSILMLILTIGFIILTGYLYNFEPFCLKDKPFGSLFANALMGWFAFALGWAANHSISSEIVSAALPYLFLNTALYLYTTLPDIEGDRLASKKTLAVVYGKEITTRLAFFLFVLSMTFSFMNRDWMVLSILLMAAPFFIGTLRNYSTSSTVLTTKFSIAFFALVICFKLPYFFILMLAGFFGTRWYFRQRFNYDYPNFGG